MESIYLSSNHKTLKMLILNTMGCCLIIRQILSDFNFARFVAQRSNYYNNHTNYGDYGSETSVRININSSISPVVSCIIIIPAFLRINRQFRNVISARSIIISSQPVIKPGGDANLFLCIKVFYSVMSIAYYDDAEDKNDCAEDANSFVHACTSSFNHCFSGFKFVSGGWF